LALRVISAQQNLVAIGVIARHRANYTNRASAIIHDLKPLPGLTPKLQLPALRCIVTGRCGACDRARIRATRWHRRHNAAPRPGQEWNMLSPPCGDLPVGRFVDRAVQPCLQKYFASPVGQIISTNLRHPTPPEGRIMIVTDAGWNAVDAAAFCVRRDRRAGRKACERSTAR
jgi:hypothetical protein